MHQPAFRPAVRADAPVLAELVNHAGEGIPLYLWDKLREPGETAWDVGRRRAARDDGAFSYRNALIIEHAGSARSEEHTSELQSLMRISYAVFCVQKNNK